jgi:TolB-like protein
MIIAPAQFMVSAANQFTMDKHATAPLTAGEVQAELQRILSSTLFSKAPRSCALLRFVVMQMLEGGAGSTNEYAIGIEVFGRKAVNYCTGDDPIVRVQAGRLRSKLAAYYAIEGKNNSLRINIPLGGYMPSIELADVMTPTACLAFQPLTCLSQEWLAQSFTLGLNEELSYRLHREFGEQLQGTAMYSRCQEPFQRRETSYLLEGSVRQDDQRIRTSLRLTDRIKSAIAWSEQLDHGFDLPILRQERLAEACCDILRKYLGMN